jgi:CheY-like chemotaxis protein
LLADDSVTIQRVIELTFADEDIRVVAVSDGDQAIARIGTESPDIVLVDVGMPGKTGYDVAQHIKGSPALRHIPVLLLTGAFEPVDQAKAAEAGCDGVLAKPFEPQLVIARVKELLERSANGHDPQTVTAPAPPPPGDAPAADDPSQRSKVARLDNYFAQLDAAFSTLSDTTERPKQQPAQLDTLEWAGPTLPAEVPAPDPQASADWGSSSSNGDRTSAAAMDTPPDAWGAPPQASEEPPAPQPARQSWPAALPALPDAFAALLAAEQHEPIPQAVTWPTAPTSSASSNGALSEEAIEQIARRVLGRLSDQVVRDTVAELVSAVAERLVQEEIERIKASIK